MQVPPHTEHGVPAAHGPAEQTPLTQVSVRVQRLPSQLAAPSGLNAHAFVQQLLPVPLRFPSSQVSPVSSRPLPHDEAIG